MRATAFAAGFVRYTEMTRRLHSIESPVDPSVAFRRGYSICEASSALLMGSGVSQRPVQTEGDTTAAARRRRNSLATGPCAPVGMRCWMWSDAPSMAMPISEMSVRATSRNRSFHSGSSRISRAPRPRRHAPGQQPAESWIATVATENTRVTFDDWRTRPFETACTEPKPSRSTVRRSPISSTSPSTPPGAPT